MQLATLQKVYEHEGPFVSAYLEPTHPDETAASSEELRWRGLAERVLADGAPPATVEAIGRRVMDEPAGGLAAAGAALVARAESVVFFAPLGAPVGGDRVRWGRYPDLGPYVRACARRPRVLAAVIDSAGAELSVRGGSGPEVDHVEGREHPTHKVRGGGWSYKRIQNRVEETVERNAALVADHLVELAAQVRPEAVLLGGEVDARERVRRRLPAALTERVRVTDRGERTHLRRSGNAHADRESSAAEGVDDAFEETLDRVAEETVRATQADVLERLGAGLGTGTAVQGVRAVMDALRQGAVEVLVFAVPDPDVGGPAEALLAPVAVGDDPLHLAPDRYQLRALISGGNGAHTGEPEIHTDTAESALVRAGAATAARAETVVPLDTSLPQGLDLSEGVAAVLRFPVPTAG